MKTTGVWAPKRQGIMCCWVWLYRGSLPAGDPDFAFIYSGGVAERQACDRAVKAILAQSTKPYSVVLHMRAEESQYIANETWIVRLDSKLTGLRFSV